MRPIVAKDLMSSDVLTVREDLPVRELANFFLDNEITGAPVEGTDGTVVGVVSVVKTREEIIEDEAPEAPEGEVAEGDEEAEGGAEEPASEGGDED